MGIGMGIAIGMRVTIALECGLHAIELDQFTRQSLLNVQTNRYLARFSSI